jgi:hypothetical protein
MLKKEKLTLKERIARRARKNAKAGLSFRVTLAA